VSRRVIFGGKVNSRCVSDREGSCPLEGDDRGLESIPWSDGELELPVGSTWVFLLGFRLEVGGMDGREILGVLVHPGLGELEYSDDAGGDKRGKSPKREVNSKGKSLAGGFGEKRLTVVSSLCFTVPPTWGVRSPKVWGVWGREGQFFCVGLLPT